jgi:non-ribosomal peptide synthetase-like protein
VRPVVIGRRNYIGNTISFPPGARTGENVLFATKAMVPLTGPVRHDVGLLGSPCLEIPRTVRRDEQFGARLDPRERAHRLAAKTRHNLVTMALHLLVDYLLILGWLAVASAPLGGTGVRDWAGGTASLLLDASLMLALFVLAERAVTGFRRLRPRSCSILQVDFWRHERYWKVAPTSYVRLLDGTPLKPLLWRLLGVPIGRGVFDDGLAITERTLVSIGDHATFNMGATLQSHTLEDGAFKSDLITVGEGATVGTAALINYDVVLGDRSIVEPDAFVMKGSRVEPGSTWHGNPATEVAL